MRIYIFDSCSICQVSSDITAVLFKITKINKYILWAPIRKHKTGENPCSETSFMLFKLNKISEYAYSLGIHMETYTLVNHVH